MIPKCRVVHKKINTTILKFDSMDNCSMPIEKCFQN